MRPSEHSDARTLTIIAYALPALRSIPWAGFTPAWHPAVAQLAVKIGWTAPENDTLEPQVHTPDEQV